MWIDNIRVINAITSYVGSFAFINIEKLNIFIQYLLLLFNPILKLWKLEKMAIENSYCEYYIRVYIFLNIFRIFKHFWLFDINSSFRLHGNRYC